MTNLKYTLLIFLSLLLMQKNTFAQDDVQKILEEAAAQKKQHDLTIATFKGTRIINMHTLETVGKRTLDFRISHRFGTFNSGPYNFYGLDGGASIRIGLEYSYDGRLMGGIGRSSYQKMFDGFLKYRLSRQTEDNHVPLSVTLLSCMYFTGLKDNGKETVGYDTYQHSYSRMSYTYEIIAGRKFSKNFSVQIAPYLVHMNQTEKRSDKNDIYGISGAVRYKFTRSMAITAEYAYNVNDYSKNKYYDSFGIGFDVETGGHIFQFHVVNSFGIVENQFIPYTTNQWSNAGIRLGFNISRVFTI